MKILLLGKNGQVGWELQRALQPLGEVVALDRSVNTAGLCGDIANFDAIQHAIAVIQPEVVVNATAYTAVDLAETDQEQADRVNHLALAHLAKICKAQDILVVHYSTDYVFDGSGAAAWQEDDQTAPLNHYGQTKRAGEIALQESQVRFINFRTCWVYASRGNNFIKTMLKLAQTRTELGIIDDQVGVPTGAALIADITAQALRYYDLNGSDRNHLHGHYHLAPQGETTWYSYAQYVFEQARNANVQLKLQNVKAIRTEEYPTPAKRPLNSRLNTAKLQQNFKIYLPTWQQGVAQAIAEIL